jgi:hypothetical protein
MAALAALAAGGEAGDQDTVFDVQVNHYRRGQTAFAEQVGKCLGLGYGARVAIQQEAAGAVFPGDTTGYDSIDDLVIHQPAFGQDGTGHFPERRAGFAFGAKDFPGGNRGDVEMLGEEGGLRPLAATRRPKKQQNQSNPPETYMAG